MQLLECIAQKPGLIENKILKFDERVTIVYGKNESGKSLIAKAIIDTLWGEFSGPILLNGNIWEDLYFEISFINSLNKYRFIRNRKERFSINYANISEEANISEKEILQKVYGSETKNTGSGIFADLYNETNDKETISLFNKIDINTFINISYLPDPIEISRNGKLDYNVVQRILLNDNSNFYSLYENLSDAFINTDLVNNNSILTEIAKNESEFNNIKMKLDVSSLHVSKLNRIKKERLRLENELKELNIELLKVRRQKSMLLLIQKNLIKLDDINAAISEKNNEKKIEQKKNDSIAEMEEEIRHQYPQFFNFEESNIKNLKTIQETYREVRDIYEDIGNFYLEQTEKKNKFKNIILFINLISIIIMAGLFGVNYVYPVPVLNEYKIRFIIGLLSLSISSSALFFLYGIISSRSGELKEKMKKKYKVERKLEGILKKNNIMLNEYKLEAIYEYLVKYFEEYGEYSIKQSELLKMKNSLKGNNSKNSIDDELQKLKIRDSIIKKEIDHDSQALNDPNLSGLNGKNIIRIINEKNRKIIDIKDKIRQTSIIISQIDKETTESVQSNETISLIREKNEISERLNKLNSYKTSLEFIISNVKEAIIRREEKQINELFNNTTEIFHFLTNNQYKETIKDDTIKKMIKGEIDNEVLNIPVIHLLQLSIKLAITDLFDDLEINLPLIIDEPFQNMDEQRISRFREIVNEKSGKRQIVIFTHNSTYKDWGSFIEL